MSEPFNPWNMPGGQPPQPVPSEAQPPVSAEPVAEPTAPDAGATEVLPAVEQTSVFPAVPEPMPVAEPVVEPAVESVVVPVVEPVVEPVLAPEEPALPEPEAAPEPAAEQPNATFAPPSGTPSSEPHVVEVADTASPYAAPVSTAQAPESDMPPAMPRAPEASTPSDPAIDPVVPVIPPAMAAPAPAPAPMPGAVPGAAPAPMPGAVPGAAPYATMPGAGTPKSAAMAIASLVMGGLALLTAWIPFIGIFGLILAIIGLGLAAVALFGKRPGKGFAIGGLVTSILAIIIAIFALIAFISGVMMNIDERVISDPMTPSTQQPDSPSTPTPPEPAAPAPAGGGDVFAQHMFDRMNTNTDAIKYGDSTDDMPPSFIKSSPDVEFIRLGEIPTLEGSWDTPAKAGRWAVGQSFEATVRSINMDASSEVTDPVWASRLDGTNKYISVEYEVHNYTTEDDGFAHMTATLVDPTGSMVYHSVGINGGFELLDKNELKAGETAKGKGYYLVPKDFEGRVLIDVGLMLVMEETEEPPQVYFFELK